MMDTINKKIFAEYLKKTQNDYKKKTKIKNFVKGTYAFENRKNKLMNTGEKLKEENRAFSDDMKRTNYGHYDHIYKDLQKNYGDIISKYEKKKYKIPHFNEGRMNLFGRSPFLTEEKKALEAHYNGEVINNAKKLNNMKNPWFTDKKHIKFFKKLEHCVSDAQTNRRTASLSNNIFKYSSLDEQEKQNGEEPFKIEQNGTNINYKKENEKLIKEINDLI
ncbi:MAG: hypothetical protein MJ252_26265, partial [archaeon]|nr:hypothetical protein [archaeon]